MRINLDSIDKNQFNIKIGNFCGKEAYLINPALSGTAWTQNNSIFRSSIWDENGKLISGGLKKFCCWGENPANFPAPESLENTNIHLKLDGSLCAIDFYNGQINLRSRGTFCVDNVLDNWPEFHQALDKYPAIKSFLPQFRHLTLILEHLSPTNRIVIAHPEVDFVLLNVVDKRDYTYWTQRNVDMLAILLGTPRPKRFSFESIDDILNQVKDWRGEEGVCLYYNNDQSILKIKSLDYLKKHSFRSNLSLKNLLELFLDENLPQKDKFLDFIEKAFDFECREMSIGIVDQIEAARQEVNLILTKVMKFVGLHKKESRKEFALEARNDLGEDCGLAFCLLDNKELDKKVYKRLYYRYLNI